MRVWHLIDLPYCNQRFRIAVLAPLYSLRFHLLRGPGVGVRVVLDLDEPGGFASLANGEVN